jgi:hypothetical protein
MLVIPASAAIDFQRPAVEVPAMEFHAVLKGGHVITTWKRYIPDDFSSYNIVKSSTVDSPMYPQDILVFSSINQDVIQFEDGKVSAGTWKYRLCIVTRFGDRWASPVVSVTINPTDLQRPAPTPADFEL